MKNSLINLKWMKFKKLKKAEKEGSSSFNYALLHPEHLNIIGDEGSMNSCPKTSWISDKRSSKSAAATAVASLITAYLGRKKDMVSLYRPYKKLFRSFSYMPDDEVFTEEGFKEHMKDVKKFVNLPFLGLRQPEKFAEGIYQFSMSRGVELEYRCISRNCFSSSVKKSRSELLDFLKEALLSDIPSAALNYSSKPEDDSGRGKWIAITGIRKEKDEEEVLVSILDPERGSSYDIPLDDFGHNSFRGTSFVAFKVKQLPQE